MSTPPCSIFLVLSLAAANLAAASAIEPSHAGNDLYQSLLSEGLTVAGTRVPFPEPMLHDGDSPDDERKALRALAGSDQGVKELVRDSVTAPQVLKVRDVKAGDGTIIRIADLWFVVRARIDQINPADFGSGREDKKPVSAGNMQFSNHVLTDDELKERGIERKDPRLEWYTHMTGDLLDRIHVESTNHLRASQSEASWVFASRTEARFDSDAKHPNVWWPVKVGASTKPSGPRQPYAGGASTTKISRLQTVPGALLVEGHVAFTEPRPWFDGAPILRSKISLVAQDRIRQLRRDLAKQKSSPGP
jgi:hypothetical protein